MKSARLLVAGGLTLAALGPAVAAPNGFSEADKAFVSKVSQGGMYEVELGKVAETQGATQDIRDQGNTETHDHTGVGDKLKAIAEKNGFPFPAKLNGEFQARLNKLKALNGAAFDRAYIEDMKKIHAADGAAFAKEAKDGSNAELRDFARETHRIVERHIGELDVNVP